MAKAIEFGAAGKRLWDAVNSDYELSAHELSLLAQCCRTVDALEALQVTIDAEGVLDQSAQGKRAHPALVEARQQRLALGKLFAQLNMPNGVVDTDEQQPKRQRRRWPNGSYGLGVAQ